MDLLSNSTCRFPRDIAFWSLMLATMKSRLSRALTILVLILVALCWMWMRGDNLWNRGILDHDEGHALLNANTWHHVFQWVLGGGPLRDDASSVATLRDSLHREGGTLYSAGKFGYSLLLAAVALPSQVTAGEGLLLAWICGILVCVLAGVLVWQYTGIKYAGAIAGIGCSLSPLLTMLSREVSGTIWALMFSLMGACAVQASLTAETHWKRRAWGITGGLSMGYGFTCHYNIAPLVLAIFAGVAYQVLGDKSRRRSFGSLLVPVAGFLVVIAIFEAATQVVDYRLRNVFPEYQSFLGELHRLFFKVEISTFKGVQTGDGVVGWGLNAWLYYLAVLVREGPLLPMSLLAGLWILKRRKEKQGTSADEISILPALLLVIIPLLFWAAYSHRVERVLGMCVAAGWILAGVLMAKRPPDLILFQDNRKMRFALFIIFIIVNNYMITESLRPETQARSPIPAIVDDTLGYMVRNGGIITAGSFDTKFAPLWKWTIVEHARQDRFASARQYIDFSRFAGEQIVFVDPATWQGPQSAEFTVQKSELVDALKISTYTSRFPNWRVGSFDLRTLGNKHLETERLRPI
jgi:hypothetical protein